MRARARVCARARGVRAPQCYKCFRAMAGSTGRHTGSRRCAFYEAAHEAVDAGSNPPAGLVAADPGAAPPQPPRRASNWDAGIRWLGTLDPTDHLRAPGGRMTLEDLPSKPSAALFGDCVDLALALYKDNPAEVAKLLHLLPRMLLGRLSQERLDLTQSSTPYGRSRLIEATVKDRCRRFLDDSANWELLHNEAHVELATAAAEAQQLAAARDPDAPQVTKSEADRADRLVHKSQPGRALKVLTAQPLADTSNPAVLQLRRHAGRGRLRVVRVAATSPDSDEGIDCSAEELLRAFERLKHGRPQTHELA